jgi:molecular chaperone GrpE
MTDTDQTVEDRSKIGGTAAGGGSQREQAPEQPGADELHPSPDAPAPGDGGCRAQAAQYGEGPGVPVQDAASTDEAAEAAEAAEIEGDLDELVRTAAQRDEYLALAQRTQADFENYRKRVARDAAAAQERGVTGLAKELLPALDSLDRALEAAAQDDPLLEGVRLVCSELTAALARAGIESFSPVGETFDPAVHEAVATAEQPADGMQSGTVVEVYQPGYRLGTSIIRPASVVVAA